jgi:hypothetical protein
LDDDYRTINLVVDRRDWERIRDYTFDGQETGTRSLENLQREAVAAMLRWIEEHPLDEVVPKTRA